MAKKIDKKARREMAIKRAKRKKIIIISVVSVLVFTLAVLIIVSAVQSSRIQTYTDGAQTMQLHPDGSFVCVLYHGIRYEGTYTKSEQDGFVAITYTYGGTTVNGTIVGNSLYYPVEWIDSCNHNNMLTLQ